MGKLHFPRLGGDRGWPQKNKENHTMKIGVEKSNSKGKKSMEKDLTTGIEEGQAAKQASKQARQILWH